METLLKSITRVPDGASLDEIIAQTSDGEEVSIVFNAVARKTEECPINISGESMRRGHQYIVKVKKWMTQKTVDASFDFMLHWNNNTPMPLRVMKGRVLNETRGMVYMELVACPMHTDYCMKCGKPLSHPVSRLYGLGPECGAHYHINPFNTEAELQAALSEVEKKLNDIKWSGWIAKSGVAYATEVLPDANVAR